MRLPLAAREQLATLLAMLVDVCVVAYDVADDELDERLAEADAIVDALLGYGSAGPPRGEIKALIDRIRRCGRRVVSLDLPSGLDATSGRAPDGAASADATLTLALPKRGLLTHEGLQRSGRLYLGDLGIPAALYARLGIDAGTPFARGPIVRINGSA
jgi:NAD(P)H-hydrate epimerase